ncbi:MAG: FeoA domain-containing protein [Gemmatimonadota bacterium]|nr:FeoA domain-containing protein [Gemmatimonadota bacterium]MDE2872481.1 FeoA domain-containing protein [Gemmatimonadota bacterium]
MPDPTVALLVFFALVLLCAAVAWPVRGIAARLRRVNRLGERVHMEDVLKQLYKLEYKRLPATAESVAGGARMPRHRAIRMLQRLEEGRLVTAGAARFRLTEPGRAQALHIVRTHRLWERFLADRTATPPEDWHGEAETHEHLLSAAEADNLAAALGHPVYDPHGDPIPTAAGEMPARAGVPLSSLEPGECGLITHLEDEPREIYRELVGLGLGLMAPVERLEGGTGRVCFRSGERRYEISSALARNVTVEPSDEVAGARWSRTLADIGPGDSATVAGISPLCRGPARRRLLDLGVVPGTVVQARMRSAAGDPVAYDIRGALVALRREQAAHIQVDGADEAEGAS